MVESASQDVVQSNNEPAVNLAETLVELPSPAGTHLGDWPGITVPSQPLISSSSNVTYDIQLSGELTPHKIKLECGPVPNLMVALPNIGGALCSTPQSLADAHY